MLANAGAKLKKEITSYATAESFYKEHSRRGGDAKLANNTVVRPTWRDVGVPEARQRDQGFEIILHSTPIVTFWKSGSVTLNSGGLQTVTTKARMNELLRPIGVTIDQAKGQWYVREIGSATRTIKFFDGIEFRIEPEQGNVRQNKPASAKRQPLKPATYGYSINLNERGLFSADVVEDDGHVLYEVKSDPDDWDTIHEVEDGWMRHAQDVVGLTAYLVHLGVIARGSRIVALPEAERLWKRNPADAERPFTKGSRVQLHAATDDWMRGDRYGVVTGYGYKRKYRDSATGAITEVRPVLVRLDKSRKTKPFHPSNLFAIE